MLVGYARVSTSDQQVHLQMDALTAAGCGRIYAEKASGAQRDRPELAAALDYLREGDTLVVWKLDRLARSLGQLIETVARAAHEDQPELPLYLLVLDGNTPAARFYERLGGRHVETLSDDHLSGQAVVSHRYRWDRPSLLLRALAGH